MGANVCYLIESVETLWRYSWLCQAKKVVFIEHTSFTLRRLAQRAARARITAPFAYHFYFTEGRISHPFQRVSSFRIQADFVMVPWLIIHALRLDVKSLYSVGLLHD